MNKPSAEKPLQLPFSFAVSTHMGRDDFMVSSCNRKAYELVESWPNWLFPGLFIYGPAGCGKSHLVNLFLEKIQSAQPAYAVSLKSATDISMKNVRKIIEKNDIIIVENVTTKCNAEALFHLFNAYNQEGKYMLWTSRQAPHHLHFSLRDLQSRLDMLPCVEIEEPDDVMLQTLIVKLFNDRQLMINPEILNYIVINTERSFEYVRKLVNELDRLSLIYKCAVNHQIIRRAIDNLAAQSDKEPDLFGEW